MEKLSLESQTAQTKLLDNTLLLLPPDKLTIWLIGMPLVIRRMLILFFLKGPNWWAQARISNRVEVHFNVSRYFYLFIYLFAQRNVLFLLIGSCGAASLWNNQWMDELFMTPSLKHLH